jgi:hypothetical protein
MRIAPKNTEEWFRADCRVAIVITVGVPILCAILIAMKLLGTPPMSWREVWFPMLLVAWLPPATWGSAYLSRYLNRRAARLKK